MNESIKKRIETVRRGEVPAGYVDSAAGMIPVDWRSEPLYAISEVLSEQAGDREFETLSISAGIGFVNQAEKFGKELSGKQYAKYTVLRRGDLRITRGTQSVIRRAAPICSENGRKRQFQMSLNVSELLRDTLNIMSSFSSMVL